MRDLHGKFLSGAFNPRYTIGMHINDKGYIRISTRKGRGKYQHRYIIEEDIKAPLCAGYVFPEKKIPQDMTVHHVDHDRTHNCRGNLQLLQKCIHDALSRSYQKYILAHYDEYVEYLARKTEEEVPF